MKRIYLFLCATFILAPIFAQEIPLAEAKDILKKVDQTTAYYGMDFTGEYSLVQKRPGQGDTITTAIMYRRDSKEMCTIRITGPESDVGKGYWQAGESIWFYDPNDRQFTFSAPKDKFQKTNVNNSDLRPQHYAENYEIKKAYYQKLNKTMDTIVFELSVTPKAARKVDYPMLKLWVSKDNFLTCKREDYGLSGQLLRVSAIPKYQPVPNSKRLVPLKMVIQDRLRGQKIDGKIEYETTQVTVSNVSFQKLGDVVYSKQYLENMSI